MKCPNDDSDLMMTERQGIEIDYCPKCRGVWLDRGELDKIIERAAPMAQEPAPVTRSAPAHSAHQPQHQHGHHDPRHQPRHKKKSMLGEIFDF